jgi:glycerol-3-phosphate dehydrogenase subunit B
MRLGNALARALAKARIRVISGLAAGFTVKKDRVAALTVHAPHEEITVNAAAAVLATGKFLSGGLSRDERLKENLFDLPVFYKGKPAGDTFMYDLVTAKIHDPQPIFACGPRTDAAMRPVDARGRAVWPNVFAAGSILSGFDPFRDRCGSGVAVSTGCEAGKNAAQCATGKEIGT